MGYCAMLTSNSWPSVDDWGGIYWVTINRTLVPLVCILFMASDYCHTFMN